MDLPRDPLGLAAALPDVPRWLETRALLLSGDGVLHHGPGGGALVMETAFPLACVVGAVDSALLGEVLAGVPADFELLVQTDVLDDVAAALADWTVAFATVHTLPKPWTDGAHVDADVLVSEPPDQRVLQDLPADIRRYPAVADAVAVRVAGGRTVCVCAAGSVTETLWDVGIDTLEGHRRRGHAAACFRALAAHMAARGKQPVWGAEEDNAASLALAAKLGFVAVDRLGILTPTSARSA